MRKLDRAAIAHRPSRVAKIGSGLLAVTLLGGLVGCSSDDSDADPTSADDSTIPAESGDESNATDEETNAAGGSGTGTLTLADGTEFTFEMSTCETSDIDDAFLVADGYDLFGETADGDFQASFNRAGFDESSISEISTLEGEFDENGKNANLIYTDVVDTMALTVDGANVSGTLSMSPIGPNEPYGAEVEATVDVSC